MFFFFRQTKYIIILKAKVHYETISCEYVNTQSHTENVYRVNPTGEARRNIKRHINKYMILTYFLHQRIFIWIWVNMGCIERNLKNTASNLS